MTELRKVRHRFENYLSMFSVKKRFGILVLKLVTFPVSKTFDVLNDNSRENNLFGYLVKLYSAQHRSSNQSSKYDFKMDFAS